MKPACCRLGLCLALALPSLLIGCGGMTITEGNKEVDQPPLVNKPTWEPNDAVLAQFRTYTYFTNAAVRTRGAVLTGYEWDPGDGTATVTTALPAFKHAYVTGTGSYNMRVRAWDSRPQSSDWSEAWVTVREAPNLFSVATVSPSVYAVRKVGEGKPLVVTYTFQLTAYGTETVAPAGVLMNPGDPTAGVGQAVDNGGGLWSVAVTYTGAATPELRYINAFVQVEGNQGTRSQRASFPIWTLETTNDL